MEAKKGELLSPIPLGRPDTQANFTSRGNQCCVAKCRLFSQANLHRDAVHVRENSV